MKKWILWMALPWCLWGCHSHVFTTRAELSRSHTYISFEHTKTPYVVHEEVGGEYISNTKIIAFDHERYQIEVTPRREGVSFYIDGNGVEWEDVDGPYKKIVEVREVFETFIHVSITAHPAEQVTLTITPLPKSEP